MASLEVVQLPVHDQLLLERHNNHPLLVPDRAFRRSCWPEVIRRPYPAANTYHDRLFLESDLLGAPVDLAQRSYLRSIRGYQYNYYKGDGQSYLPALHNLGLMVDLAYRSESNTLRHNHLVPIVWPCHA